MSVLPELLTGEYWEIDGVAIVFIECFCCIHNVYNAAVAGLTQARFCTVINLLSGNHAYLQRLYIVRMSFLSPNQLHCVLKQSCF